LDVEKEEERRTQMHTFDHRRTPRLLFDYNQQHMSILVGLALDCSMIDSVEFVCPERTTPFLTLFQSIASHPDKIKY
jgi:hypothetical protein